MFAVIKTGGKQYRVAKDDKVAVEKLAGEAGDIIELGNVLMLGGEGQATQVGAPYIEKAAVFAEVIAQTKGDKVLVFKKRRRKNSRRLNGHRQNLTLLRVVGVSPTGEKPAIEAKAKKAPKAEAAPAEGEAKPAKKKAAPKKAAGSDEAPAKKAPAKKAAKAKKSEE